MALLHLHSWLFGALCLLGSDAVHVNIEDLTALHMDIGSVADSVAGSAQVDAFVSEHGLQGSAAMNRQQKALAIVEHMARESGGDCDLCRDPQRWLFVLATGRTGSTTIVEMLNAIPGFRIAGENKGMMDDLMDIYKRSEELGFGPSANNVPSYMLHGNVSKKQILCGLQGYVRLIIADIDRSTRVIGFKEIRHTNEKALSFFEKVFPCAQYIINYRYNLRKQQKSAWFPNVELQEMKNTTDVLVNWQEAHADRSFKLPLEHFSRVKFNQALQFIGVTDCSYMNVAHDNNGHRRARVSAHPELMKGDCFVQRNGYTPEM